MIAPLCVVWGKRLQMLPEQLGAFTCGLAASSESDLSDRITIECILEDIYIRYFCYSIVIRTVKIQHGDQV